MPASPLPQVTFNRDEDGQGDIDAAAAKLMGITKNGERVRCHSLPGRFDVKMGLAMHFYMDIQAIEHKVGRRGGKHQA